MLRVGTLLTRLLQATAAFPCTHLQELLGHDFHEFLHAETRFRRGFQVERSVDQAGDFQALFSELQNWTRPWGGVDTYIFHCYRSLGDLHQFPYCLGIVAEILFASNEKYWYPLAEVVYLIVPLQMIVSACVRWPTGIRPDKQTSLPFLGH